MQRMFLLHRRRSCFERVGESSSLDHRTVLFAGNIIVSLLYHDSGLILTPGNERPSLPPFSTVYGRQHRFIPNNFSKNRSNYRRRSSIH